MAEPFLGQIESFAFGYAPRNWAQCAGQLLAITQNQALFSLLGTTYGGNGVSTFALPDLRGGVPIGQGSGQGLTPRTLGETGGEEAHALQIGEMPPHNHVVMAISNPDTATNVYTPDASVALSKTTGTNADGLPAAYPIYAADDPTQPLAAEAIGVGGGGVPHANMMPYLTLNFCIALQGVYPSRN